MQRASQRGRIAGWDLHILMKPEANGFSGKSGASPSVQSERLADHLQSPLASPGIQEGWSLVIFSYE